MNNADGFDDLNALRLSPDGVAAAKSSADAPKPPSSPHGARRVLPVPGGMGGSGCFSGYQQGPAHHCIPAVPLLEASKTGGEHDHRQQYRLSGTRLLTGKEATNHPEITGGRPA